MRRSSVAALLASWLLSTAPAAAQTIQSALDAAPPPQSEHYVAQSTGQVVGPRLFRDAVPSVCGTAKANPGPFTGATPLRYDAFTFTALETKCQVVRFRRTGAVGIIHAQLHSAFDPADVTVGYLADSGSSVVDPAGGAFAFDMVAGQTYTLVLMNVNGAEEGATYEVVFDDRLTTRTSSTLDATPLSGQGPYWDEVTGGLATIPTLAAPASTCGAAKAAPGETGTGPYRYDSLRVMSPISTCLTVTLRRLSASGALAVAAYSSFTGSFAAGWLADSGAYTAGATPAVVSFSMTVTAGQIFDIVVVNGTASEEGAQYELELSSPVQPPRLFRTTSVSGNTVSFRWVPPLHGPTPTNYLIEGGVAPAQVLASIPTGSANPLVTFAAPSGAFYVRARAVAGAEVSAASNETQILVNQAVAPSAPANLLATQSGSTIGLAWRNTFTSGQPTGLALDVTGSATASIPLGLADSVAFGGVPGGSYTLRLRATNPAGTSVASNPVAVTVPGVCAGVPQPPANFLAYRVGNLLTVVWDAPTTGPAPTSYTLLVSGAFTGAFATAGRTLFGTVPAGAYTLAVQSNHACGSSVPTNEQTVVVP
ncbi:MAG: hypothetical protein AB7U25_10515 [Vicinamibacterales bacterium]